MRQIVRLKNKPGGAGPAAWDQKVSVVETQIRRGS